MVACATLAVASTAFINTGTTVRAQTSTGLRAQPAARADSDAEIEQTVRRQVQPMLIAAGGMAVALNLDGRTLLFNYGLPRGTGSAVEVMSSGARSRVSMSCAKGVLKRRCSATELGPARVPR
jgi:hypothetical protein